MLLETAEPKTLGTQVNGDSFTPESTKGFLVSLLNGSQRPIWRKIFSCLNPPQIMTKNPLLFLMSFLSEDANNTVVGK